jgi:hypothetical protein
LSGQAGVPSVDYCQNHWQEVDFQLPADLPALRTDAQLELCLESEGKVISENRYDVTIASSQWADGGPDEHPAIQIWDPARSHARNLFDGPVKAISSLDEARSTNVLVIGSLRRHLLTATEENQLRDFVSRGGRVLMMHPGAALPALYPDQVGSFTAKDGEIATMHVPESPVFSEIQPLDLAWFPRSGRQLPLACTGVFGITASRADVTGLAWQCDIHGYLKRTSEITNYSGHPLVEIQSGQGRLLASELNLEAAKTDPIACRILMNSLHYLATRNAPPF